MTTLPEAPEAPAHEVHSVTTFLTYGTLRTGEPNHARLLAGKARSLGTIRLRGFTMFDGGGYPYAVPTQERRSAITVEVFEPITNSAMPGLLRSLDRLEGFYGVGVRENHYERSAIRHALPNGGGDTLGWLYTAAPWTRENLITGRGMPRIAGGDWLSH